MAARNDKSRTDKFQKTLGRTDNKERNTTRRKNPNRISQNKTAPLSEFAEQALELCDEFSEVQALNFFLYEAIEGMLESESNDSIYWPRTRQGLAVFLRWLKTRETGMKNMLQQHQSALLEAGRGK